MKIAILGPGAIGSTFACHLAQAGHSVTVIARGQRLATLRGQGGMLARHLLSGKTTFTALDVSATLDTEAPWDLLLVTVQRQQLDAVMPAISASAAKKIMFMFNTATDLRALREAVGRDRFIWGFPAAIASIDNGELHYAVLPRALGFLQITTIGALPDHTPDGLEQWQALFSDAGIATSRCRDMSAWLKTHAGFMVPLMAAGVFCDNGTALSWSKAGLISASILESFGLLHKAGIPITPWNMKLVSLAQENLLAACIWSAFRSASLRNMAQQHIGHARAEIDTLLGELRQLGDTGNTRRLTQLQNMVRAR